MKTISFTKASVLFNDRNTSWSVDNNGILRLWDLLGGRGFLKTNFRLSARSRLKFRHL